MNTPGKIMHGVNQLNRSDGFSLIEVLISMLILAVGLLGIAVLQFKGLQYSTDAAIRSNITMLVYDLSDRMRLNRDSANSYLLSNYNVPVTRPPGCTQASGSDSSNDLNCWQRLFWVSANASHVPPNTQINVTNTGDIYNIRFSWTDRESTVHNIDYAFIP